MFDTATLTISGNVVSDPKVIGPATEPDRVTFRVVSNRRRRDFETGEWRQVDEFGINVVCWRKLARGVAQALRKGDPVLVQGRVSQRKFDGDDGQTRSVYEITADFVGHDLSQGFADRFTRFTHMDSAHAQSRAESAGDGGELDPQDPTGVPDGIDDAGAYVPTDESDTDEADAFESRDAVGAAF